MCKTCKVDGCNGKHQAKGYCNKHYLQYKRHGYVLERTRFDPNEIIEYEDYAEIVLYNKDGNEIARTIIDLEYVDIVKEYKWYLASGYVNNNKVGDLHRLIMNPPEGMVVDHINRNPLDNRRDNLRICAQSDNCLNKSIQCNNTSGVPGVSWEKTRNKWAAYIRLNGKQIHLGRYNTIEEAAEARRSAEIEYFGEYAPTNN
jgi:hypothetical protein